MIAAPISKISLPGCRPAFRVVCAWCEKPIRQAVPAGTALTRTSHGICNSCAMQHFGVDLSAPLEVEIQA